MKIKKNGIVMDLTDSDIKKLEESILNEQVLLLWSAAIMAYRQTAAGQAKKLTRKIKRNLKDLGIKSNIIEDGNLNKLMKCINGELGKITVSGGKKQGQVQFGKKFNKSIVKRGETGDLGYEKFKKDFKSRVGVCCNHFNIASECDTVYEAVLSTINDFRDKKFRL